MLKIVLTALVVGAAATGPLWFPVEPPADTDREKIAQPPLRTPPPPSASSDSRHGFGGHSEPIERIELGMARGEVLAIAGTPDREDLMSTDFGHDVALWYGGWEVWLSDRRVRSVTYYG
jgi:hypothetical protein